MREGPGPRQHLIFNQLDQQLLEIQNFLGISSQIKTKAEQIIPFKNLNENPEVF